MTQILHSNAKVETPLCDQNNRNKNGSACLENLDAYPFVSWDTIFFQVTNIETGKVLFGCKNTNKNSADINL